MKLLTKDVCKDVPLLYTQEDVDDPTVHIKFFHPISNWTWYVTEAGIPDGDEYKPLSEYTGNENVRFFGYVQGFEGELGYFTLNQLKSVGTSGKTIPIERDMHFQPQPLSNIKGE